MMDRTIALLREGYAFLPRRRPDDVCETRLLGQRTACLAGEDATRLFYDERRFERRSATPRRVLRTLFGRDGVQTLDGAEHKRRKELFLELMSPASLDALRRYDDEAWATAVERWRRMDRVVLFTESAKILLRAACDWTGVPLAERDELRRARDLVRMVDAFGAVGPRHRRGRSARRRSERWAAGLIEATRAGRLTPPDESALAVFSRRLPTRIAAVELLNVIRPTVAISWLVSFAADALHRHPEWRDRIRQDIGAAMLFAQEVRRFYPFTPFLGARAREDFSWSGHDFQRGQLVLLDVYGAGHDPRIWDDPERFDPDRFVGRRLGEYEFIPQGGGDPAVTHRCPGEEVVLDQLIVAIAWLTRLDYRVPEQDLEIPLHRMPTRPSTGFVLTGVREGALR